MNFKLTRRRIISFLLVSWKKTIIIEIVISIINKPEAIEAVEGFMLIIGKCGKEKDIFKEIGWGFVLTCIWG